MLSKPLRPFDKADGPAERILQPKFKDFVGIGQSVKIGMPDLVVTNAVALHQSICRRGNFLCLAKTRPDQSTGEMGLACADGTFEQKRVTRPNKGCKPTREPLGILGGRKENRLGLGNKGHAAESSRLPPRRKPLRQTSGRRKRPAKDRFQQERVFRRLDPEGDHRRAARKRYEPAGQQPSI